jgi:hypothetical protein
MITIIDNFLSKTYYKSILELLSGHNFDWKYLENITDPENETKSVDNFNGYGLSHTFWDEKKRSLPPLGPYMEPLLYQIMDIAKCDFVLRARADMVTWSKDEFIHPPHADFLFPNTASIFYVNETDGDTIIYKEQAPIVKLGDMIRQKRTEEEFVPEILERVSPKANRLVLFDGSLLHTGSSPTKHKNRILINSNYIKNEDAEKFKGK